MAGRTVIGRLLLILAALLLHGSAAGAEPEAPARQTTAGAREILVMLRLPAPHFRPDAYYAASYRDDAGRAARRRVAETIARDYGLTLLEDWAMPVLGVDCYRMAEPASAAPGQIVEALGRDKRISWAQPVNAFAGQGASDPLYPVQPAALRWQLSDIRKAASGRKVLVAVIDSGVEPDHPDLAGQLAFKENFVDGNPYMPEHHGTGIAGVIAARAGNGVGIEGVAPDARIMALRACWEIAGGATRCNSFTLGKALNFALMNGAQVVNLSLTGPPDRLLRELIDVACARGLRVVSAVDATRPDGGFPASHPGVFAVAGEEDKRAGTQVLTAPGRDIPTAAPGGRWDMVSGSSYSAAHISGMMAVLSELRPTLSLAQLRAALVRPAASATEPAGVDVCATVTRLTGKCTCECGTDKVHHAALR